jgi:hypothetical protein
MGIISRLFRSPPKRPPLPPLPHPRLGVLTWDADTTCWKGIYPGPPHTVEIYIGLGERDTYPDEAACNLVAETLNSLPSRDAAARPLLLGRFARLRRGSAAPEFKLNAVQTFRNYVPKNIVELVYETVPDDLAIWRVSFTGNEATSVGRDD